MSSTQIVLIANPDYMQIKQHFLEDLTVASQGHPSSISFIRHVLPKKPLISSGIVQGIVIGGTRFDIASVEIDGKGKKRLLKRQQGILPQFDTKETFLMFIKEHIDSKALGVAINLGFPLQPDTGKFGEIDSKILYGVKEHAFHGLLGLSIGDFLRQELARDIPISVANDAVCLTLAGTGEEDGGFVLGSGCNMAITVQDHGERIVANLESANFNKFEPTPGLEAIDAISPTKGKNRFEKLISGIYLPMHFNFLLTQYNIQTTQVANAKELDVLAAEDTGITGDLARAILERSASLAATELAAVYEFKGSHKEIEILAEGTVIWEGWEYQNNIQKRLTLLGVPEGKIKIKKVEDSSLHGAIGLLTR